MSENCLHLCDHCVNEFPDCKSKTIEFGNGFGNDNVIKCIKFKNQTEKGDYMSENEKEIEKEIQAKGLNAPRLKPSDIDEVIKSKTFTILPSGKAMICEILLKNGFSVRGESAVVSKENFDKDIGEKLSFGKARDKIWQLEAYLLQQNVFTEQHESLSDPEIAEEPKMTFVDRIKVEKKDLDEKCSKLVDFFQTENFKACDDQTKSLLKIQSSAMRSYSIILDERIKLYAE